MGKFAKGNKVVDNRTFRYGVVTAVRTGYYLVEFPYGDSGLTTEVVYKRPDADTILRRVYKRRRRK